eukprot:CCRYP_016088-RA/>CCRYP_016088-RA protein AED:0.89 eAED:0.87 QI:0/0/0/0.5/1/1/2/0/199
MPFPGRNLVHPSHNNKTYLSGPTTPIALSTQIKLDFFARRDLVLRHRRNQNLHDEFTNQADVPPQLDNPPYLLTTVKAPPHHINQTPLFHHRPPLRDEPNSPLEPQLLSAISGHHQHNPPPSIAFPATVCLHIISTPSPRRRHYHLPRYRHLPQPSTSKLSSPSPRAQLIAIARKSTITTVAAAAIARPTTAPRFVDDL